MALVGPCLGGETNRKSATINQPSHPHPTTHTHRHTQTHTHTHKKTDTLKDRQTLANTKRQTNAHMQPQMNLTNKCLPLPNEITDVVIISPVRISTWFLSNVVLI